MIECSSRAALAHTSEVENFNKEVENNIASLGQAQNLKRAGAEFFRQSIQNKYSYNFSWMGLPIIQYPQDLAVMQEIIWKIKPDTIVEAGVARGGSLIFYAGMMEMMGIGNGKVIGIDIDIRAHNRQAIEQHPMSKRITLIDGSSIEQATFNRVKALIADGSKTVVCLDSMHAHAHVLEELHLYSPIVTPGSYLVVFDTVIEHLPKNFYPDRPWGPGDNPYTAVQSFLQENNDFEVDHGISDKVIITCCPGGFLRKKARLIAK